MSTPSFPTSARPRGQSDSKNAHTKEVTNSSPDRPALVPGLPHRGSLPPPPRPDSGPPIHASTPSPRARSATPTSAQSSPKNSFPPISAGRKDSGASTDNLAAAISPLLTNTSVSSSTTPPLPTSQQRSSFLQERIAHELSIDDPTSIFSLKNLLGKGSFGYVYQARDIRNGHEVAIKIISLIEDSAIDDVNQEIATLKDCRDPHIIQYFGSYFRDENLWSRRLILLQIVMEYCEGGSVGDILKLTDRPLVEDHIALICRETLKGLRYMHSLHKIHRDIKGGNILLTGEGQVKLADFGVSAALHSTFAKRNTFAGTPYWMAPEVISEAEYDGRADIWSLGITCIEMAELRPPHADVHPWRVLFKIPKEPPPALVERRKWSAPFHDFLALAVRKNPSRRPTAEQLLQHPFMSNCKPKVILRRLVDEVKKLRADRSGRRGETTSEESGRIMGSVADADYDTVRSAAGGTAPIGVAQSSEFQKIYRQDCTIQVPWLSLNVLSPATLLTPLTKDEIGGVLSELSGTHQTVEWNMDRLMMSPMLLNLVKTYAYNRQKLVHVPMSTAQAELTAKAASDLSTTLKTILRI